MLRITSIASDDRLFRLKVEGRLTGEFVDELSRVVAEASGRVPRLALDLADVSYVDHSGAALLRSVAGAGVELVGASPFILTMINGGL